MDKNLFAKMSDNSIGNKTSSLEKDLDNVSVISDASNISNISDLSNITISSKDFFLKSDIRFKHFKQKPAFIRQIIILNHSISTSDKFHVKKIILILIAFIDIYLKNGNIYNSDITIPYNFDWDSILYKPTIDTVTVIKIKELISPKNIFNKSFKNNLNNDYNFYTDTSKLEEYNYVGFAIFSQGWERDWKLQA